MTKTEETGILKIGKDKPTTVVPISYVKEVTARARSGYFLFL